MADMQLQTPESIAAEVDKILGATGKDLATFLHREILLNALKCKRDDLDVLDLKIINRAMEEFRFAARAFEPFRARRKVSIFGSARTPEADPYYQLAVLFGQSLADKGYMVITGAGDGIMRAGIEGAGLSNSFGVNILLPFESGAGRIMMDDPKLITFRYFFTRKVFFVMQAHAFAFFPGGFGTHDELFEVLTLLQTGKASPVPLVLMELPGEHYWEAWSQFVREQLLARSYVSPEDLSFIKIAHSVEEGLEWIRSYYSTYHSMRWVRGQTVIRLEKELSDDQVRQLNESFFDLLASGEIVKGKYLPEEANEPQVLMKPRLIFSSNQRSAGRLHEMVLMINRMGEAS